jgi:hypothetical protein
MLMWSYYAEGHFGFVVGVEIVEEDVRAEPVDYVPELRVESTTGDVAKQVLMKNWNCGNTKRSTAYSSLADPLFVLKSRN